MNRDLGMNHNAGKGDNDRTSDVEKFRENLSEIPLHPEDKTGFEQVGTGKFRKTYGKPATKPEPTPDSLLRAARASRAFVSGNTSEH